MSGIEVFNRQSLGAFLLSIRQEAGTFSTPDELALQFHVDALAIAKVERGSSWPTDQVLNIYSTISRPPRDPVKLIELRDEIRANPHGLAARKLSQVVHTRRWGTQPGSERTDVATPGPDPTPGSFFELAYGFVQEPRRLSRIYEVLPWTLAFWQVAFVVLAGAPFMKPSIMHLFQTTKTVLVVVLILSIIVSVVISQMVEFPLKLAVLPLVRKIPGIHGMWTQRAAYFGSRPEIAQQLIDHLIATRQLEDVVAAGAAVELSERTFTASVSAAITTSILLIISDARAMWFWTPGIYAVYALFSLALILPAMSYALTVIRRSLGEV